MIEDFNENDVKTSATSSLPERCVVVVTYNSAHDIADCLSALRGEDILVIDNASRDGTGGIAAKAGGRVQVTRNRTNVGFGAAANQGMRAASGCDIVLVNPDVRITRDVIDELQSTAQRTGAGVVAPRLVYPGGPVQESARRFPSVARLLARRTPVGRSTIGLRWLAEDRTPVTSGPVESDWVIGAVMYLPRQTIETVGGFDEQYFLYGEDVDLCARCWQAGLPVIVAGHVEATHSYARASKRTFSFQRAETRHHWVSILRLARTYPRQFFTSRPLVRHAPEAAATGAVGRAGHERRRGCHPAGPG
jgi:GT2 family glycosyltransferase